MKTSTASSAIVRILLVGVLLALACPALAGTPGLPKYDVPVTDAPGADVGLRFPALARDNTMYVGGHNGCVYAISPDGTIEWVYEGASSVRTNAAVYYSPDNENAQYNGTIYVGLLDGRLVALDPAGNKKWNWHAGTPISSPALAADGTIYVGKRPAKLVAIRPNGMGRWSCPVPGGTLGICDPVVGPDGTIYFGTRDDEYFYAVDSDGEVKWATHIPGGINTPAAIGRDGTIYFGGGLHLHALWPNGDPKWSRYVGEFGDVHTTPVIGHEGTIYVSAGALIAINPDGSTQWHFWYEGERPRVICSAAVDSNGLIYAPGQDGYIYCVAPGGTFVWRYYAATPGDWLSAPVVGSDGLLYSTEHDRVSALYTGATGPFDGPWPMYRRDAACSARLDKYWYMMINLRDLLTLVARADLSTRIKKTLTVKAKSAMQSLERGHIVPVKNKLGAFINHVQALEGKKISVELADVLIRDALHILTWADADDHVHRPPRCRWKWRRTPHRFTPRFVRRCRPRPGQVAAPHRSHCNAQKKH